jgi:hypothetical protein
LTLSVKPEPRPILTITGNQPAVQGSRSERSPTSGLHDVVDLPEVASMRQDYQRLQGCAFVLLLVSGCGSGEGNGDAGVANGETQFTAAVLDSVAVLPTPVGGLTVKVVDNESCELGEATTTSDAQGRVAFGNLSGDAKGQVAFLVQGRSPDYIDTWSYNIDSDMKDEVLRAVPQTSADLTPSLAQFEEDPGAGPVAGAVFVGENSKSRTPVGCVTIKVVGQEDNDTIRYFSGSLPQVGLSQTSPDNGRFFVGNLPPGRHTIVALHEGEMIGEASLCVTARNASTTGKNVSLVAIYIPSNPAPGCR